MMASPPKLQDAVLEWKGSIVSAILSWPAPFHCDDPPLSHFLHSLKHCNKIRPQVVEDEEEEEEVEHIRSFPVLPLHGTFFGLRKSNRRSFFRRPNRWFVETLKGSDFSSDDEPLHEPEDISRYGCEKDVDSLQRGIISRHGGKGVMEAVQNGIISRFGVMEDIESLPKNIINERNGGVQAVQRDIINRYRGKEDIEYLQKLGDIHHVKDSADIRDSNDLSMISRNGRKDNIDTLQKLDNLYSNENRTDLQASIANQSVGLSSSGPVSKEQIGHATWIFLHTLAAQFPDKPTRQQRRDAKELMAIISRLYPCKECADHFKEILKANPVQAGSGVELAQWMCKVHNIVNRSLQKPSFPCHRVDARWGALHCNNDACNLQGRMR